MSIFQLNQHGPTQNLLEQNLQLSSEQKIYTSLNGQTKDFLRICAQNIIYDEKEKNEDIFRWAHYIILNKVFLNQLFILNK